MSDTPKLGPVALCTLVAADGAALVEAYTGWMHQQVSHACTLDGDTASAIGYPDLTGRDSWILANRKGREWLQVIDFPEATSRDSLACFGWLAMEVLVEDVDSLAADLADSPFELLRAPADLDVSDKIRACQVRGPAGEILYLTQVRGEVPPFDLPSCDAPVDHLFIPVLSTPSRDDSLAEYSGISGNDGISFDTRITVVNQARGFELERRHPVATLQLAGKALVEIDQIDGTRESPGGICSGTACIALYCRGLAPAHAHRHGEGPFQGYLSQSHIGRGGEHVTLLYS